MRPLTLSWPRRIVLAVLVGVLAAAASHGQWFWKQDEAIYDTYVGSWEYTPDPRLLVVAIDDSSLQQLGQWPWPRSTLGDNGAINASFRTQQPPAAFYPFEPRLQDDGAD